MPMATLALYIPSPDHLSAGGLLEGNLVPRGVVAGGSEVGVHGDVAGEAASGADLSPPDTKRDTYAVVSANKQNIFPYCI